MSTAGEPTVKEIEEGLVEGGVTEEAVVVRVILMVGLAISLHLG